MFVLAAALGRERLSVRKVACCRWIRFAAFAARRS
jgi:hypothetical protein